MKKNYVSPLATEVNFETEAMMLAASPFGISEVEVDTNEEGVQLGGGRRGTWGDVWK